MPQPEGAPRKPNRVRELFARVAIKSAEWTGSVWAFSLAALVILVWVATGPIFHYSDTWQLVINTGTTIITFLMVFLIQHAQNRDTRALHIKLNELLASVEGASNHLIDIEEMDEEDLIRLQERFRALASEIEGRRDARGQTSVEEVQDVKAGVAGDVRATKREHERAKRRSAL